jgi:hypothetical protein
VNFKKKRKKSYPKFRIINKLKFQKLFHTSVDIYQKKVPIFLIIVLVGILILQYVSNDQSNMLIDPQTCELYIKDSQIGGKQYLDEFDSKCLTLKNLNP